MGERVALRVDEGATIVDEDGDPSDTTALLRTFRHHCTAAAAAAVTLPTPLYCCWLAARQSQVQLKDRDPVKTTTSTGAKAVMLGGGCSCTSTAVGVGGGGTSRRAVTIMCIRAVPCGSVDASWDWEWMEVLPSGRAEGLS